MRKDGPVSTNAFQRREVEGREQEVDAGLDAESRQMKYWNVAQL